MSERHGSEYYPTSITHKVGKDEEKEECDSGYHMCLFVTRLWCDESRGNES